MNVSDIRFNGFSNVGVLKPEVSSELVEKVREVLSLKRDSNFKNPLDIFALFPDFCPTPFSAMSVGETTLSYYCDVSPKMHASHVRPCSVILEFVSFDIEVVE